MEISDFLPLIYLSVGLIATYFIGKLLLGHFKEIKKVKRGIEIQREKKSFENGVEDLLDNAPSMYSKVIQELEYLKQNNATPEQMASLQKKADLLKTVIDNQEIINIAGKPIIKWVGKFIGGIGK
jgi:phosphoserine aminotransferase|tara:strand:+ start:294 stop:668 length:375 start_codon:yes stop_codon:yes gene_type:complete